MPYILFHMSVLAVLLLATQKYCRESRNIALLMFVISPVILTPYWLSIVHQDWFAWMKLYSVIFGDIWLIALCYTSLQQQRWAKQLFLLILFINILEAVIKDFSQATAPNTINACTGILILLPLLRSSTISITDSAGISEMQWQGVSKTWIICYSLWNLMFIYLSLPFLLSSHIIVILIALIIGMKQPERWLQTRAYTLGIMVMLQFTFGFYFKGPLINSSHWYTEQWALPGAIITLALVSILYIREYVLPAIKSGKAAENTAS